MNYRIISLLLLILGVISIQCEGQETTLKPTFSKEVELILYNVVPLGDAAKSMVVKGRLNLYEDHLIFHVYVDDELKPYSKNWQNQQFIKDIRINYNEINKIKRGYLFWVIPVYQIKITKSDGISYLFQSVDDKLKIIEFIKLRM
ncbi:MAG: hypothetical protein KF687_04065 [Cyclobacteriaceae bacterium]|nr:hypothetical protein [Cyclobacteriaceae bacterium]